LFTCPSFPRSGCGCRQASFGDRNGLCPCLDIPLSRFLNILFTVRYKQRL